MKKIFAFTMAALALLAISCNKEPAPGTIESPASISKVFQVDAPDVTKTALSGATSVVWSEGDQITVIAKTSENQYTFTLSQGAGTKTATFSGEIAEADKAETEFFAFYPASVSVDTKDANHPLSGGNITVGSAAPPSQLIPAVKDGFSPAHALMVAKSDSDGKFAFHYGTAFFKIQINAADVKSVYFESSGSARFGGRPSYSTTDFSTTDVQSAKNNVTLVADEALEKDGVYYVPVQTKQSNVKTLTLKYTLTDGTSVATLSTTSLNSVTLQNGVIYDLGCPPADFSPILKVDDVFIEAAATSGSIVYSLTNPTADGVLTAAITDGKSNTIGSFALGAVAEGAVPFTCEANATAEARYAYVTLTYTYNGSETLTKDVVIEQPGTGAPAGHTYIFYVDDDKNVVQTKDDSPGSYFTITGTSILDCSASGYFAVDSFTIKGKAYSHAKKIDGSNGFSFTTHSTATTTIRFFAAKRQADKDGVIKLQKGSTNIVNETMTLGTIFDSGEVTLDKGTEYKFNKTGEVGLFYVEVVETL